MTTKESLVREISLDNATLDELAAIANREHDACEGLAAEALHHAIAAGNALIAARSLCEDGGWFPWLDENFAPHYRGPASEGRAQVASFYMRLAHNSEALGEASPPSLAAAKRYLRDNNLPGPWPLAGHGPAAEERIAEARSLHAAGLSMQAVADTMGVSKATVLRYCNEESLRKQREASRNYRKRQRAAERALREKENRSAARRIGGAREQAYADGERLQDVLAQAHRDSSSSAARASWALAEQHYRRMRDAIVAAIGEEMGA